jgi:hypothetical protein
MNAFAANIPKIKLGSQRISTSLPATVTLVPSIVVQTKTIKIEITMIAIRNRCSTLTAPRQSLELMTGIEPVTSPLPRECSTN